MVNSIWNWVKKNKALVLGTSLIYFLISLYNIRELTLNEDISAFVPQDSTTIQATKLLSESGFSDKIIVLIEDSTSEDHLIQVGDSVFEKLQHNAFKNLIRKIDYKAPDTLLEAYLDFFYRNLVFLIPDSNYSAFSPLLTDTGSHRLLADLKEKIQNPFSIFSTQHLGQDPVGLQTIAWKLLKNIQPDGNFEIVDGRILTKDHHNLILFITPNYPSNNTQKNGELVDLLEKEFSIFPAYIYGGPVVAVSNSRQMKRDTLFTSILAIVLILGIMIWYFRSIRIPLLLFTPVLFGAISSLSLLGIFVGEISVIAIAAGSIVLGIAINYSLHFLTHLKHEQSIPNTLSEIARPMLVGCITTAGAFFALTLVKSQALQQLGMYAGLALIHSAIFTLLVFPLLVKEKQSSNASNLLTSWLEIPFEKNKFILISVLGFTILLLFFSDKAGFEKDLMKMNFLDEKTHLAELKLETISSNSIKNLFVANSGATLQEALEINERLNKKIEEAPFNKLIQQAITPSSLIPSLSKQTEKRRSWTNYWNKEKLVLVRKNLESQARILGFKPNSFEVFLNNLASPPKAMDEKDIKWVTTAFFNDFIFEKNGNFYLINQIKSSPENRETLTEKLIESNSGIVLDKQHLTKQFIQLVSSDFNTIIFTAGGLVFFVLLLSYGRIELTLINFLPMVLSWIWLLGIMGIFGLKFNIVNIIIGTLLFGLGDDYSIFVLGGQLEEFKTGKKVLTSFKSSIFLSALTTLIGVGVLIFAKHPALKSIALVTIIGMVGVLIISFTISPFLFRILALDRKDKNYLPYTAISFILSFIAFFYFLIGCTILNVIGAIQFRLLRQTSSRSKFFFHQCLSWFTGSLVYLMANVKKKIINQSNETFEKPAILISNHQSFLDILTIQMLSPRMILLTNEWVWNSPFFGTFIKYADYLPVADGIENNIEKLKAIVDQGYSILVWPEGTRSPTGKMKRFHKGAFLLAKELQLDIIPIITHGTGYTMSKGDFLLKNGEITLKIMPRIKAKKEKETDIGMDDFGELPADLAKNIGKWFRNNYANLCYELETPRFYKEKLIKNYIYKGPVLEWYARIKIRLEDNYTPFHKLVPLSGKITDIGCGYGFLTWMLSFLSPERKLIGLDYDESKIEVASNISTTSENVSFKSADIVKEDLENSDVFIMADVLHYLTPDEQKLVLQKMFSKLNPNGLIIIRDGDSDLLKRQRGTWLTEFFSTTIFGFNKTQNSLHFISGNWLLNFALLNGFSVDVLDTTKLTSNKIWILKPLPNFT
ncbi:MAG: MMPL family transporter [Bacteroidia bacterium]|nr:MMPL family transporter [Bacteroidia bacterium]